MKVGFTGTRKGVSPEAFETLKQFVRENSDKIKQIHHGDCKGADSDFHLLAEDQEIDVIIHPPVNPKMRGFNKGIESRFPKKYIERNHQIVNETDMLVASPETKEDQKRSGTWATVRYARKQHKRIYLVFPDGSAKVETNKKKK